MAVNFYDLISKSGLEKLDNHLKTRSYITGYQPSKDDITVHTALKGAPSSEYVDVSRWFNHIEVLLSISGVSADDDYVDLFGEKTEEKKAAAEEHAAAVKKRESGKSSVLLDVKPWDSELVAVGNGQKLQIRMTVVDDLVPLFYIMEPLASEPSRKYIMSVDIIELSKT
ncbi:hypothetical protein MKX03_020639 [Papaver bracteatum]|nr:hypothetical protein MKX03_020639 [Papaver bracteatum]